MTSTRLLKAPHLMPVRLAVKPQPEVQMLLEQLKVAYPFYVYGWQRRHALAVFGYLSKPLRPLSEFTIDPGQVFFSTCDSDIRDVRFLQLALLARMILVAKALETPLAAVPVIAFSAW